MTRPIQQSELDAALRRCGSGWNASQAHGLLCSRLALRGVDALDGWLRQVLEGTAENDALQQECAAQLRLLFAATHRQLSERGSRFELLLPDDLASASKRTDAMAQWCEGFLHGLVIRAESDRLKKRLASDPLSDIIRDLLEITRAEADDDADSETNEVAYAEVVEYLRVVGQLVYEELVDFRDQDSHGQMSDGPSNHVH
jgi:yecA family protein